MSTHNIRFYGEIWKIIPKLPPNTLLICSTVYPFSPLFGRWLDTFVYLGFMAHQDYFTHFELSRSLGWSKTGHPREKTPDHPQAELVTRSRLEPTAVRYERFRALKISGLNPSATELPDGSP